jgi:plasmid maintenance system antidote protein VapI
MGRPTVAALVGLLTFLTMQAFMGNDEQGAEFWLRLQADYDIWQARQRLKSEVAQIVPAPRVPSAP